MMHIVVKSNPDNYRKEEIGKKNNTVRLLDGKDKIQVHNTETNEWFERTITDITTYKDMIIISFKEVDEK